MPESMINHQLPSIHHRFYKPPIQPILPQPCLLCVLCDLCGRHPIMQNKPNSKIGKMALSPYPQKPYAAFSPLCPRKNKPNQTQFFPAIRDTSPGPLTGLHACPLGASRNTNFKYDIAVPSLDRPEMKILFESQLRQRTRRWE